MPRPPDRASSHCSAGPKAAQAEPGSAAPARRQGASAASVTSAASAAWQRLAVAAQARPAVSRPGDAAEREADQMAERVMRMPDAATAPPGVTGSDPRGARHDAAHGAAPTLHRKASADAAMASAAGLPLGRGEPLPAQARAFFEPRFGRDFADVRMHHEAPAQAAAQALSARAFTLGGDVAFAAGAYDSASHAGRSLLAHELTHVVQQGRGGAAVLQRQPAPASTPPVATPAAATPAAATPVAGTLADVQRFVSRPADEPDTTLAAAMAQWRRYSAHVNVANVRWLLLPESERESHLGSEHHIGGRSHWDNATPVVELPQVILDDIAGYLAVRGAAAATVGDTETPGGDEEAAAVRLQRAPLERAHEAVRLIGHELFHLWRSKEGNPGNPLQQPFERESARRMDAVRANWVAWLHDAPPAALRERGIPRGTVINRWEDIPAAERTAIEEGAAKTDHIDGLYQRSAYLVEEIYTKVEEMSYLRVQQRDPNATVVQPSLSEVSKLATLVYYLHNVLRSAVDPQGLVTPALLQQTETAMLAQLRRRYPAAAGAQFDSYEVVFYLSAIHGGLPPLYSNGRLISSVPGARVPP